MILSGAHILRKPDLVGPEFSTQRSPYSDHIRKRSVDGEHTRVHRGRHRPPQVGVRFRGSTREHRSRNQLSGDVPVAKVPPRYRRRAPDYHAPKIEGRLTTAGDRGFASVGMRKSKHAQLRWIRRVRSQNAVGKSQPFAHTYSDVGDNAGLRGRGHSVFAPVSLGLMVPRLRAPPRHEHPVVLPQVLHFMQVPLRTSVKLPHSPQASPS